MKETTLIIIKPEAVKRGLMGKIISRFEKLQFEICYINKRKLQENEVRELYEHLPSHILEEVITCMCTSDSCIITLKGESAIKRTRIIIGSTDPLNAEVGSIRGMFATSKGENCIHASDSIESFLRESDILISATY